jgi:phenylacetate-CoA ligase
MHEAEQRAEYDLLMQSQFWPADRIRDLQRERLEKLLRHARAHVPFYATRLDILFRPDGSIDWDRWGDVPTLKRSDLLDHRRRMLARTVPAGHEQIVDASSSGSTGRPVTTAHSSLALKLTQAAVFRANVNDELDFGKRLGSWIGERAGEATWPEGKRGGRWGPSWDKQAAAGETFTVTHTAPPHQALEFLVRHGVRYALMGGTDARLLAFEAQRLGIHLPLDGIFTRGTDPTPFGTQLVAQVFGARTLPLYSSKEGHRMAHRCPQCGRWHVNDEQVLIEILDEHDRPVAPGESGRVVITPFWSYAQPLIRYEQGDYATRGATSDCGKGLSAIAEIVGRVRHMFVMPDGSRIVPTLTVPAVNALNAAMFQVAQISREAVEVRYAPLANGRTANVELAKAELAVQLHTGIATTFREVPAFDVKPGRKHIEFVSELGDQGE